MRELKTVPELESLWPKPSPDEKKLLEKSLVEDGCKEPIIVWAGKETILDGHQRYRICKEHNIPFDVVEVSVEDLAAARWYAYAKQVGRRNVSPAVRTAMRGELLNAIHAASVSASERGSALREIAKDDRVSHSKVRLDARIARALDALGPLVSKRFKQGKLSASEVLSMFGTDGAPLALPSKMVKWNKRLASWADKMESQKKTIPRGKLLPRSEREQIQKMIDRLVSFARSRLAEGACPKCENGCDICNGTGLETVAQYKETKIVGSMASVRGKRRRVIGKRLRNLRLEAGITQRIAALGCGVSKSTYQKWEQNKQAPVDMKAYRLMTDLFRCSIQDIIGEDDRDE